MSNCFHKPQSGHIVPQDLLRPKELFGKNLPQISHLYTTYNYKYINIIYIFHLGPPRLFKDLLGPPRLFQDLLGPQDLLRPKEPFGKNLPQISHLYATYNYKYINIIYIFHLGPPRLFQTLRACWDPRTYLVPQEPFFAPPPSPPILTISINIHII